MNMFHAIAMHGDLRDIPFTEKILQVKFTAMHPRRTGQLNTHRTIYRANSIYNAPVNIWLDISDDSDRTNLSDSVAMIGFIGADQCLNISASQFNKTFGGSFLTQATDGPDLDEYKFLDVIGNNKTAIEVSYIRRGSQDDFHVVDPGIAQLKPNQK